MESKVVKEHNEVQKDISQRERRIHAHYMTLGMDLTNTVPQNSRRILSHNQKKVSDGDDSSKSKQPDTRLQDDATHMASDAHKVNENIPYDQSSLMKKRSESKVTISDGDSYYPVSAAVIPPLKSADSGFSLSSSMSSMSTNNGAGPSDVSRQGSLSSSQIDKDVEEAESECQRDSHLYDTQIILHDDSGISSTSSTSPSSNEGRSRDGSRRVSMTLPEINEDVWETESKSQVTTYHNDSHCQVTVNDFRSENEEFEHKSKRQDKSSSTWQSMYNTKEDGLRNQLRSGSPALSQINEDGIKTEKEIQEDSHENNVNCQISTKDTGVESHDIMQQSIKQEQKSSIGRRKSNCESEETNMTATRICREKTQHSSLSGIAKETSEMTMTYRIGDTAPTIQEEKSVSTSIELPDVFDTLSKPPITKAVRKVKTQTERVGDLEKILKPVVRRIGAPWLNSSVMMGQDADLKLKIWVRKEYKDELQAAVMKRLREKNMSAPRYTKNLQVVGLDEAFPLQRKAGMTLLPGLCLHLSNGHTVRLTGFFVAGSTMYAITTTHLEDLRGQVVQYENQMGEMVRLGRIVDHTCQCLPFTEACLVKVDSNRIGDVGEFVTYGNSQHPARFINSVYTGAVTDLQTYRPEGLINYGAALYHRVVAAGIRDYYDVETKRWLEKAVMWTSSTDDGGSGESGASILGMGRNGNYELLAMYIGHFMQGNQRLLLSAAMKDTVDYFNSHILGSLQVYNFRTRLPGIGGAQGLNHSQAGNIVNGGHAIPTMQRQPPSTMFNMCHSRPMLERDMKQRVPQNQRWPELASKNTPAKRNKKTSSQTQKSKGMTRHGDTKKGFNDLCIMPSKTASSWL